MVLACSRASFRRPACSPSSMAASKAFHFRPCTACWMRLRATTFSSSLASAALASSRRAGSSPTGAPSPGTCLRTSAARSSPSSARQEALASRRPPRRLRREASARSAPSFRRCAASAACEARRALALASEIGLLQPASSPQPRPPVMPPSSASCLRSDARELLSADSREPSALRWVLSVARALPRARCAAFSRRSELARWRRATAAAEEACSACARALSTELAFRCAASRATSALFRPSSAPERARAARE
mmetsp:Transcript_20031/g.60969  ORF Transcript_20031/g.60969 Transcript_20031/m.60969 type:complete len:251 (+) Transcript_20031:601-1353(+)